jgi:hypothetical protein
MSDLPPPPPPPPSGGWTPPPPGGEVTSSGGSADSGSALSYGWAKFQQNAGVLIAIVVVPFLVQIVLSIIGQTSGSLALILVLDLVGFIGSIMAQYGINNAALIVTRGEHADFAKAFQNDRWGEWILFAILYAIAVAVGLIGCGIGILVTIGLFGLAPYYFIDGRLGAVDAIKASFNTTKSNTSVLISVLVCAIVGFLGFIACGVGALVTIPMSNIAICYLYRNQTGQPVAP